MLYNNIYTYSKKEKYNIELTLNNIKYSYLWEIRKIRIFRHHIKKDVSVSSQSSLQV